MNRIMDEKNSRIIKWNQFSIISSALSNWLFFMDNAKYIMPPKFSRIFHKRREKAHYRTRRYIKLTPWVEGSRIRSDRLVTNSATYLESFAAAGHGSEDIVTVHGTEDQARTIPRLGTETTTYRLPAATLQTTHAHGWQKLRATFDLHLERNTKEPDVPS